MVRLEISPSESHREGRAADIVWSDLYLLFCQTPSSARKGGQLLLPVAKPRLRAREAGGGRCEYLGNARQDGAS